ncbi:hypothetical protein M427DRAFT_138276 [Gonapodya prolifera JEL478]|uniref:Ankyrin n=1 Tax=Gonapodya prolifera (strain JEL478) TaxID=1344416 RepID=A0A139A4M2_GONPJ|nr:hypothetical protein M427DRAFT_138276 [Gonapodya prolifera JEL478]|eukprot:KXS11323.1 hypothetical protein M427DRAFT_138276 [Gonapodya prolifera JEL478]
MGSFESRVDSRQCESTLALAIHSKNFAIVQALIRYGADVQAPIEWALPGFFEIWDEKAWSRRWRVVYNFPDALSLAAGVRNTVTARGGPSLVGNTHEFPSMRVNCNGGNVSLVNPCKDLSIYSGECGPDMLAVLTAAGANPTLPVIMSLLERGFGRNNKIIYDTDWLAPLLIRPQTIAPATINALSSTVEQLQRTVVRLQSELDDLRTSQALVLVALNEVRATEADLRQEVVGLRRRMGDGGQGGAV